jgi:hypothetical protein
MSQAMGARRVSMATSLAETGDDRDAGRLAETSVAVSIAMYYY